MKSNKTASISILLPVLNGRSYLDDALDTLLSQSFTDFEVIICDDGSSDGSYEILERFASEDKRIKLVKNNRKLGLFGNYNRCLEKAQGEYIKPFAQDDLLHPEILSRSFEVLEENPTVSLVSVGRRLISADGELIDDRNLPKSSDIVEAEVPHTGSTVIQKCLFPLINYLGEPSSVMFRQSAKGVGFDQNFYHIGDIEYWMRILLEGDYYFIPEDLCYFRNHQKSASVANSLQLLSAVDIVRLSKKFGWIIESCDYTEEEFLGKTVDDFSSYLRTLITAESISLTELRQAEDILLRKDEILACDSAEEREALVSRIAEDLTNFRELAFIALAQLGQKGSWVSSDVEEVAENKIKIKQMEDKIRELLNSPSWKSTKIFREFNRPFIDEPEIRFDQENWQSNTNKDTVAWQRQYIDYLQKLIDRILDSRSWKLTRPIRSIVETGSDNLSGPES